MGKSSAKLLIYGFLLLVLFLIMVLVAFSFKGKLIRAEILALLFLMFLALIGFSGYPKGWGERVLFFVFVLSLGNLVFIWYFTQRLFLLPLLLALLGLLLSWPKKEKVKKMLGQQGKKEAKEAEPYSEIWEAEKEGDEEAKEEKRKTRRNVEYSPGKYVASRMGSVYHEPRCDWAKKIEEGRRVWFEDKKEAKKKGYEAHSCVRALS